MDGLFNAPPQLSAERDGSGTSPKEQYEKLGQEDKFKIDQYAIKMRSEGAPQEYVDLFCTQLVELCELRALKKSQSEDTGAGTVLPSAQVWGLLPPASGEELNTLPDSQIQATQNLHTQADPMGGHREEPPFGPLVSNSARDTPYSA